MKQIIILLSLFIIEPISIGFHKESITPFVMQKITGGSFTMGSNDPEASDDETPHNVTVSNFLLQQTEVTVAQFKAFIDDTNTQTNAETAGFSWKYTDKWEKMEGINWRHDCMGNLRPESEYNHPVVHVSWNDALAYCQWLQRKTGKAYRLPTEAEWEFAAGNGSRHTKYSWGNGDPTLSNGGNIADEFKRPGDGISWTKPWKGYNDGYWFTAPVRQFGGNDFGLYDMTGNVWEWCADFADNIEGRVITDTYHKGVKNPKCTHGETRVLRGGGCSSNAKGCRIADRYSSSPYFCYNSLGFRVALSE